ncbi:MAG: substrate-binding domain-containing protein [Xanthomonadales bacterium]|nr:substrate-binding domain-containing protein [Xanthomonadales bacterium]
MAATSDVRSGMKAMAAEYRERHPDALLRISYGPSGKFAIEIRHDTPFDVYIRCG